MRLTLLAAALLATTPAFAVDAVTYRGTLGKHEIVVELASPSEGMMVGRYSYMSQGGDIPLTFMGRIGTPVLMLEEAPCTEDTCATDDDGDVLNPPMGAFWRVTPSADGQSLAGTWEPAGKSGKTLDITLERIGQRTLPEGDDVTPASIRDSAMRLIWDGERAFQRDTAPYEFAKSEVAMEVGEEQAIHGSTFRFVTDPRSKFAFPRVLDLADGSPSDAINEALERRHTIISTYAFDCLSQVYAAFGASQNTIGYGPGTLGDYDTEQIAVSYLSPTVMAWVESGSTFCGGAHPNNHSDSYALDVKTGETFPMAKVLKDWIPTSSRVDYDAEVDLDDAMEWPGDYYWTAGQGLIDYVIAHRLPDADEGFEEDCGIDELIAEFLVPRIGTGPVVVFALEGLPHVMGACGGDILTVSLDEIPELLAPTAADYFPDLVP